MKHWNCLDNLTKIERSESSWNKNGYNLTFFQNLEVTENDRPNFIEKNQPQEKLPIILPKITFICRANQPPISEKRQQEKSFGTQSWVYKKV